MPLTLLSLLLIPLMLTIGTAVPCLPETVAATPASEVSQEVTARMRPQISLAMEKKGLSLGRPIFIRIFKESDELEIWVRRGETFRLFKTYTICDYSGGLGPKEREGDKQSPEGFYRVGAAQLNPWSKFHLAFNLGYPNEYDRLCERTGGALMVHGRCSSVGCFAMTDYRMEEIYTIAETALSEGQESFAVHIFPFRMTEENMRRHRHSRWRSFWLNLQEGYDLFERHAIPPEVAVLRDRYIFSPAAFELARHP
jgi:murein L,D-transpeptidase YafK